MEPFSKKYRDHIMKMMAASQGESLVTEQNVYQPGNPSMLPFIDKIIADNLLPGSSIRGEEHLAELLAAAAAGEPCLLLLEHYSNFDLPVLHYLLRKDCGEAGRKFAEALLAIAGIKLNEENPAVLAFSEAYSRIVIYPSRSLEIIQRNYKDPKELVAEMMRSTMVNRAAMKALAELKYAGRIVLVFPSGTRFRPWEPSTKRGVREIDSYVKSFSKMCFVGIEGNILRLNPEGGQMHDDIVCQDKVVYAVSPVVDCATFRAQVKHEHHHFNEDKKQAVADAIMKELDRLHELAAGVTLRAAPA